MFVERERPNATRADLVVDSVQKTMQRAIIKKCRLPSKITST